MFITNKPLDRRTFLRGMGATVALPLLDAMIPARALFAFTPRAVSRMAFVYFPHGAIMDEWTPDGRILQPLAPFRDRLTIVNGIENAHAYGPVHAITPGTWLSGQSPRERGATIDQLAADHLGRDTALPSIAVATEAPIPIHAGIWEGQYDANYGATISFRRSGDPVPMECSPRKVFDALFSRDATQSTSVLDLVAGDTARLRKQLGSPDRSRLNDYLDTVRDIEGRLDRTGFADRMASMFDLIALAFRADITRVASMMMAAETSAMTYEHIGVPESFHALSPHQNDPEKIDKLGRIQKFHSQMFARFTQTLAAPQDGEGSMLDRSLILFGSNMSNSYAHDHYPLPLAVVGGGRHQEYADRTPIATFLHDTLRTAEVVLT